MSSEQPDELRPAYEAAIEFLRKWNPQGPWVLTAIIPDPPEKAQRTFTETFRASDEEGVLKFLHEHGSSRNIYFQVNPLKRAFRGQERPSREHVSGLTYLHVDVDLADPPNSLLVPERADDLEAHYAAEQERILAVLREPPERIPPPTCIVFSGGGYQAFWRLELPRLLDGSEAMYEDAKLWNRALERALGGDNCHDIGRLMRLVGTLNRPNKKKRVKGRVEALADLVEWHEDRVYGIGEFPKAEPDTRSSSASSGHVVEFDSSALPKIASLSALPAGVSDLCRVVIAQGCDPDDSTRFAKPGGGLDRSEAVFFVACELVRRACDDATVAAVLLDPDWPISAHVLAQSSPEEYTARQIERARDEAAKEDLVLDPKDPVPSARAFVEREAPNLILYNGDWLDYRRCAYVEVEEGIVEARLVAFLEKARRVVVTKQGSDLVRFQPDSAKITNALRGLRSVTIKGRDQFEPPCWINGASGPPAHEIISAANGLLHLPSGDLLAATSNFFTRNGVEIEYDPGASAPARWLAFLAQLWPDDPSSISTLQEVFGYLLIPDTSQQKVFLLIGPPRSGKGTIANVLTELVGVRNVRGIRLDNLGGDFGLAPLIGCQLAIVADMRLGPRSDTAAITENLLRISGGDRVDANRKYKDTWTGRLSVRFLLLTNELPKFNDASGALANRFVPLVMSKSFLHCEDHGLLNKLLPELPGIMNWAIDGWRRLRARGHFELPRASREAIGDLIDAASPVTAFVREECVVEPGAEVEKLVLYQAWRDWQLARGDDPGGEPVFSRDLYAAIRTVRPSKGARRNDGKRPPIYVGLRLSQARVAAVPAFEDYDFVVWSPGDRW